MKIVLQTVLLLLLVLFSLAAAEPNEQPGPPGPDRADRWILVREAGFEGDNSKMVQWCDFWSATAMYGARAYSLGRQRKVTWTSRQEAEARAEASPNDTMYGIEDADLTAHEKTFIEDMLFAGWDWSKGHGNDDLMRAMPDQLMKNELMDTCMHTHSS